jgi:hypothetical protein
MIFAHQIRQVAAAYLSRDLALNDFVQKFAPLSYNVNQDGHAEAIRLANAIELSLVDLRSGCVGEARFRASIREIVSLDDANVFIQELSFAPSVNRYSEVGKAFPGAPASFDTSRGMELWSAASHQA